MQPTQQNVDPAQLQPNPWNTNVVSPDNEAKIEASIKRFGMFKPIIVRTMPDGTLQILGGAHRRDAAVRLGIKSVPIMNLGAVSDKKAKEIGIADNGRYGQDDTLALAKLLEELGSASELGEFLPFTDTDFNSIFAVRNIELDGLDLPDDFDDAGAAAPAPKAPQTHMVMRFKVPVEDASVITEAIEKVMKQQGFTESDSLTNAGDALVHIFTKAGY